LGKKILTKEKGGTAGKYEGIGKIRVHADIVRFAGIANGAWV